ncbi:MAG: OmpA family protein [Litoreibacter sp.]
MRKILGGVILVAGVGGLGWYGSANNAKTMQAEVTSGAATAIQGTIHPLSTSVSGRDILVSGVANGEADREQILEKLHAVNGRRVVHDELRVLDTASPFALNAAKSAEGYTYTGVVPTEADRTVLASRIGDAADGLTLMAGSPDGSWTGVVGQGLDSLDKLEDGTLVVSDRDVAISGTALVPDQDAAVRAALGELPEGYTTTFDIDVLDDGTPLRLAVTLDEDRAATSSGKIPSTLETADLSAALTADVGAGVEQSVLPPANAEWPNVAKTGVSALSLLRSGQLQMTEDALAVTGVATPDGKAQAEALLSAMPDGFTATADIALYDDGEPFSLEMVNNGDATTAKGKFPAEVATADVVGDIPADGIRHAYISDEDGGFASAASSGVDALSQLEEGTLSVVGENVLLSGVGRTPTEVDAAKGHLSALPEGYNVQFDIEARDDGTPPNFDVIYSAGQGASVSGKLPAGTEVSDIASAINLSGVTGEPVQGLIGDGSQATEKLTAVSSWLPELESLTFNSNDDVVTIDAVAAPGVDQDLVQAGIADALGGAANVSVSAATDLPDEGATRTNQATGRDETFTTGFWLPVFDFAPSVESCNGQSAEALKADRIGFVTGSAQLDAQSMRAINAVAAIVRKCLAETNLQVEIGGHTDSQGGEDLNQELSQSRAEAVRTALIARGAGESDTFAKGYGEAEPIADNETEEGRAANRRTTITWSLPVLEETIREEDTDTGDVVETETNTEVGE